MSRYGYVSWSAFYVPCASSDLTEMFVFPPQTRSCSDHSLFVVTVGPFGEARGGHAPIRGSRAARGPRPRRRGGRLLVVRLQLLVVVRHLGHRAERRRGAAAAAGAPAAPRSHRPPCGLRVRVPHCDSSRTTSSGARFGHRAQPAHHALEPGDQVEIVEMQRRDGQAQRSADRAEERQVRRLATTCTLAP